MSRFHGPTKRHAEVSAVQAEAADPGPVATGYQEMAVPGRVFEAPSPIRADPLGGTQVELSVAAALRRRAGAGRPLPREIGRRMSDHLGHDLSTLRVHDDPEAARITTSLQAKAFTHGDDLYFAKGAYQPTTHSGLHTLAHEVGHVVAQRSGLDRGASGPLTVGRADDPAERLADRTAESTLAALRRWAAPQAAEPDRWQGSASAGPDTIRRFPSVLRREVYPKKLKGYVLDTDDPEKFVADVRRLKLTRGEEAAADAEVKAIVDWLQPTYQQLADRCREIWMTSRKELQAANRPATQRQPKGKTPAQKEHEQKQKTLQEQKTQKEQKFAAARSATKAAENKAAADQKAKWDLEAPVYWHKLQTDPSNTAHGADLKFLVQQKYITLARPHRCFLSRHEKDNHGNRLNNRFGVSMELQPVALLSNSFPGGSRLVIHLHCNDDGKVRAAGVKYLAQERLPGGNLLLEGGWVDYLKVEGITGDNVETKVQAFD